MNKHHEYEQQASRIIEKERFNGKDSKRRFVIHSSVGLWIKNASNDRELGKVFKTVFDFHRDLL